MVYFSGMPLFMFLLLAAAGCGGGVILEGDGAQGDVVYPDPVVDDVNTPDPELDEIDAPPPVTWARSYGGGNFDWTYGARQTPDGGYILAGETLSFSTEQVDIIVISLDANGDVLWRKTFGSEGVENHRGLAIAPDGGCVITGARNAVEEESYDILAIKIDAAGAIVWQYAYGGRSYDWGHAIEATSDHGFIIAGITTAGGGTSTMMVLKINKQGRIVWQKRIPRETYYGWAIAAHEAPDGGYIIGGGTYNDSGNGMWVWVLKLDEAGNIVWQKAYGGETWDDVWSIRPAPDGGTIAAGSTQGFGAGLYDFWILRLDAGGDVLWQKTCGGTDHDHAKGVDVTADGGFVITGETWSAGAGNDDILLVKLDAGGNVVWQRTYGGPGSDWGWSVLQADDSGFFIYGETDTFGAGEIDIWALKTDADGLIGPDCPAGIGASVDLEVSSTTVEPFDTHASAYDAGFERRELDLIESDIILTVETQCGE